MNRVIPLLVALVCAGVLETAAADERPLITRDAMQLHEPEGRPAFAPPKQNDPQFDQAWETIKPMVPSIQSLEADKGAVMGRRVMALDPNFQAEAIGLEVGDVMTHVNGDRWYGWTLPPGGERRLRFVKPDGTVKEVDVRPGRIGPTMTELVWRGDLHYIRHGQRDPKWDAWIVAAVNVMDRFPVMAEALWGKALAAGYKPDWFSDYCAMWLCHRMQGKYDRAEQYLWYVLQHPPHEDRPTPLLNVYTVMLATMKYDAALDLLRREPLLAPDGAREGLIRLRDLYRSLPADVQQQPAPHTILEKYLQVSINDQLKPLNSSAQLWTKRIGGDKILRAKPPSGRYAFYLWSFPEHSENVLYKCSVSMEPTDDRKTAFQKIVTIALHDLDRPRDEREAIDGRNRLLSFSVTEHQIMGAEGANGLAGFAMRDRTLAVDWTRSIDLTLLRIGAQGEIFVNGRRVLRVPIDPKKKNIGLRVKTVGMTYGMTTNIWALVPKE